MKRHFQEKSMMAPKKRKSPKGRGGSSGGGNPRNGGKTSEEEHDEAIRALSREYYGGVRGLAEEVINLVGEEGMDKSDALHQVVDGSYWVIYTHANFQVLMCSDHHNAYSEDFGEPPVSGSEINWAALAYAALARDVSDKVDAEISSGLDEAPRGRSAHSARSTREIRRPSAREARGPRGLRRR